LAKPWLAADLSDELLKDLWNPAIQGQIYTLSLGSEGNGA
jgi:hypothetical protein